MMATIDGAGIVHAIIHNCHDAEIIGAREIEIEDREIERREKREERERRKWQAGGREPAEACTKQSMYLILHNIYFWKHTLC
jgi:hypothetical protein